MSESENIGVVILAAGSSSRLGRPKQLVEFQNKSLLQHVIDTINPFQFHPSVLVLGANADEIRKSINPKNVTLLHNENWSEGIASSIRLGVSESIKLEKSLDGILFLLSDQPFVNKELIGELLENHANGNQKITACSYKGNVGVPAILSKDFFPHLLELKGDVGAKKIIAQNSDNVQSVIFKKGSFDVDTEEDVQELLHKEI
ncbi:nucleotidyltransferase family protein [Rhodohalobacter sulfatireducens]|uniref:Nucleotidyltransferase family protein n=1 Tax=Rhodohalobacter sulfatireducens TaxID=2911366 RepID=A0ABS9K8V0_9BACT|nr:nucleotidyltransferase family protein [Rhodohalobacter sulfatireducens]MCG2587280.1 nucleotidyltransferase family protein [Rhodohalobacter sulfatireducens]